MNIFTSLFKNGLNANIFEFNAWLKNFYIKVMVFINLIIVINLLLYLHITGEKKVYKYSKLAFLVNCFILFTRDKISINYKKTKKFIKKNHKTLAKILVLYLISSYVIPIIIFEIVILFIEYILSILTLTSHFFLIKLFGYLFVEAFLFYSSMPFIIKTLIIISIIYSFCLALGWRKLKKNHSYTKDFIGKLGQYTFIVGPPGVGKTKSVSYFVTLAEERFIDELENMEHDFEIKNPTLNTEFLRLQQQQKNDELKIKDIIPKGMQHIWDWQMDHVKNYEVDITDFTTSIEKLTTRGSMILANYKMISPYYSRRSHVFNYDSLRFYRKQTSFPHESFEVFAVMEIDKEFGSFDSASDIKDDGTQSGFSLMSHVGERKIKGFFDAQSETQLIRRIRSTCESFIRIKKAYTKYPLSIRFIRFIPLRIYKFLYKLYLAYKGKKEKPSKLTVRKGFFKVKRYDYSLTFLVIRWLTYLFKKWLGTFKKFEYDKMTAVLSHDSEFKEKKDCKYFINLLDLNHYDNPIYNTCAYGDTIKEMKAEINDTSGLKDIPEWSENPTKQEIKKTGTRFYNKVFTAQENDNTNDIGGDLL